MMKDNMESKDSSDVVYIKISYELSFYIEKIISIKNSILILRSLSIIFAFIVQISREEST